MCFLLYPYIHCGANIIQKEIINKLATELIKRNEESPVEFEATLDKDGKSIDFAEVFKDVGEWEEA